jgi:predicted O-methyltransferase YrrM
MVCRVHAQFPPIENDADKKIRNFLESYSENWRDMNVPITDGKILYDIIIKNNYKSAVEIGTSTGHSAIWMAWALSKTGGKLITVEIDRERFLQAKANFNKAGVTHLIDARLGDAHQIIPALEGKYDFVFSDADKNWYKNYFLAMEPKMVKGGCFTAHNSSLQTQGITEFVEYLNSLKTWETHYEPNSRAGISVSFKK